MENTRPVFANKVRCAMGKSKFWQVFTFVVMLVSIALLTLSYVVETDFSFVTNPWKKSRDECQPDILFKSVSSPGPADNTTVDGKHNTSLETTYKFKNSSSFETTDSDYVVPNIVHYVWFEGKQKYPFRFDNMLSVMSAYKIIQPDVIYFHTNKEPGGKYWDVVKAIPAVKVLRTDPPRKLYGQNIAKPVFETSDSDIGRLMVLLKYGGIYLDVDVIVTSPFDELRKYPCTIGLEKKRRACGGIIIGAKTSTFLYLWMNYFLEDYRVKSWAYNSGGVPYKLMNRFPELVHVEPTKFHRPNWEADELKLIWGEAGFPWWENYAVHLWYRMFAWSKRYGRGEPNLSNIRAWKGAFGEMARYILYDELPPRHPYYNQTIAGDRSRENVKNETSLG